MISDRRNIMENKNPGGRANLQLNFLPEKYHNRQCG